MIIRSRKYLNSVGWVEPGGGAIWRIPHIGRNAAVAEIPKAKRVNVMHWLIVILSR
jgi:hypothetical protein